MVPEKPRQKHCTHSPAPLSNPTASGGTLIEDFPSSSSSQWTDYKRVSQKIGAAFATSESDRVRRWGERIGECARYIGFSFEPIPGQGYKKTLVSARLCRVRTCPICQWRRSLKVNWRLGQAIEQAANQEGKRAFLLTLTIRNCRTSNLRESIKHLLKSWSKLTRRKVFLGCTEWVRSVEVTRGRLWVHDDAHPHIHALIIVPEAWCTPERLNSKTWRTQWKDILGVDYLPQCDIREVNSDDMGGGCREVLKYAVKPQVASLEGGWLERVALALDRVHILAASGSLKSVERIETEDEINEDVENDSSEETSIEPSQVVQSLPIPCPDDMKGKPVVICYKWQRRPLEYQRAEVHWNTSPESWRAYIKTVLGAPPDR